MAMMRPRGFLLCIAVVAFLFVIHQSDPHHHVFASNSAKGFSLKLNHHFPHLNLTFEERYSRYRRATEARAASFSKAMGLKPSSEFAENDGQQIYPGVFVEGPYYTVDLQIGGDNPRYFELLLDTGSQLSWTQCSSCTTCFHQVEEKYNPAYSGSYKILSLNDQYCRILAPPGPRGRSCDYKIMYGNINDGPVSIGYLGRDTFSFPEIGGRSAVQVPQVLFGCSEVNRNFGIWERESHAYIAGIFGMDQSSISMINQLKDIMGYKARFSYCLRKPGLIGERIYSFLRVGDDIPMTGSGNIQRIPLIRYGGGFHYFANFAGISVNGHLVRVQGNGIGGGRKPATNPINSVIMIDSGAPATILLRPLFNAVANAVDAALAPFKLVKLTNCPYVLCYRLPKAIFLSQLPSVEYHFVGGAVLPVISESVFSINVQEKYFMLTMLPGDINILGAHHQQDVRVLYDLEAKQLSWISADCSKDVWV